MSFFAAGTWAAIAAGGTLLGAGYSAYATYEQGQQMDAIAKYNAAQQRGQNQYTLEASAAKSLAEREENQKIMASQDAAFAASGVVTNSGSPLLVRAKQAALLERKALNTDYEGAIASRFGQSQVTQFEMSGDAAKQAGKLGAIGTLLNGASNAASAYYKTGSGLGPSKTAGGGSPS